MLKGLLPYGSTIMAYGRSAVEMVRSFLIAFMLLWSDCIRGGSPLPCD